MKRITYKLKNILPFLGLIVCFSSCKYEEVLDANYVSQKIYIPAAAFANADAGGLFNINTLAVPGATYRYKVNTSTNKFEVPLSVIRSGATLDGVVKVNITVNSDTISKMAAKLPLATTEVLAEGKFSIEPTVSLASGESSKGFTLSVDLDYLLANASKRKAIGINVSSETVEANPLNGTAIIVIDPAILNLVPIANFTNALIAKSTSTHKFSNTSTNSASYIWDFGDGTTSTELAPLHTFTGSGTYTVTLRAYDALGRENTKSVLSRTVVVTL